MSAAVLFDLMWDPRRAGNMTFYKTKDLSVGTWVKIGYSTN